MASERLRDDFLTCSLCLDLFKEPKVLNCQHTFCRECLQNYFPTQEGAARYNCICPVCKEPTQVPAGDVQQLRRNFFVDGLVHFVKEGRQDAIGTNSVPTAPPQTHCPACEEPTVSGCASFCNVCALWLCTPCVRSHAKLPATRAHTILSLDDIHTQQLGKLRQLEQTLDKMCEETDTRYDAVMQQGQSTADQFQQAVADIHASTDKIQELIAMKQEELLAQVTGLMSAAEENLNKILLEVEDRKKQLDQARRTVREVRGSGDAKAVLMASHDLQQSLRHLPPLTDLPAGTKSALGMQFVQRHSLFTMLQSDPLGHITAVGHPGTIEDLMFPQSGPRPVFNLEHQFNGGFISGMASYGPLGNIVFAVGCQEVYRLLTSGRKTMNLLAEDNKFWKKPWGVAVTADNQVLVTDAGSRPGSGFVAVYGLDGKFQFYMASGLSLPRGIAMNNWGQIFVCDQEDRCVYVFDAEKNFGLVKVLKKDSSGKHFFDAPMHVAVAQNLDILVSDAGHIIKTFTPSFEPKSSYRSPLPNSEFWGICTDPLGHVFVADWKYGVHVLNSTLDLSFVGFLKDRQGGRILEPCALMYDAKTSTLFVGNSSSQIFSIKMF